jgi:gamma-glutamyltranspeptidase/glutathione hydrolase
VAKAYAAAASEGHVTLAARHVLERGGNAVDALAAGLLAAAAESPSVLLGPLQILAAGGGAGLLAVDGRARQPGLGVPRPRGVVAGADVPTPARVAVPGFPFALAAAHGSLGGMGMSTVASAAVARARAVSPERGAVLDLFARRGTAAFLDDSVAGDIIALAGRAAGGTLTRDDLAAVRPAVVARDERSLEGGLLTVPWRAEGSDGTATQVLAAADPRGLVVAACYEAPLDGLPLPSLGLVAPLLAEPVKRGERRVRPGEPRAAAAPIALRVRRGIADFAAGAAAVRDAESLLDGALRTLGQGATFAEAFGDLPAGRFAALARTDALIVVRSA